MHPGQKPYKLIGILSIQVKHPINSGILSTMVNNSMNSWGFWATFNSLRLKILMQNPITLWTTYDHREDPTTKLLTTWWLLLDGFLRFARFSLGVARCSLGCYRFSLGFDRFSLGFDRFALGCHRVSLSFDWCFLGFDRCVLGVDRVSLGFDRVSIGFDRFSLGFDRVSLNFDRFPSVLIGFP